MPQTRPLLVYVAEEEEARSLIKDLLPGLVLSLVTLPQYEDSDRISALCKMNLQIIAQATQFSTFFRTPTPLLARESLPDLNCFPPNLGCLCFGRRRHVQGLEISGPGGGGRGRGEALLRIDMREAIAH